MGNSTEHVKTGHQGLKLGFRWIDGPKDRYKHEYSDFKHTIIVPAVDD